MSWFHINALAIAWIIIALLLIPVQLKIIAPYGRHSNDRWGLMIDNKTGWIIMEIISPLILGFILFATPNLSSSIWIIAGFWMLHYFNRSIIFPLRLNTVGKKMPLLIALFALFFNLVNASLNACYLSSFNELYTWAWFTDPRFIIGSLIFLTGAAINIQSDNILLKLRKPGEKGYKIPQGSLFKYISCPNHFGEIIEWLGFAVLCWNLPALSFFVWTAANLIPRALAHHSWYLEKFSDYPGERKAVIPFIL